MDKWKNWMNQISNEPQDKNYRKCKEEMEILYFDKGVSHSVYD